MTASSTRSTTDNKWYRALCWHDSAGQAVWRADEIELVTAAPVKSGGPVRDDVRLSDAWWDTLTTSLDNLAGQHTTRIATPDTEPITQALVTTVINRAFPSQIDTTITDHDWLPAHADLNWANLTSPACWILDWEDHGLPPWTGLGNTLGQLPNHRAPCREGLPRAPGRSGHTPRKVMALFNCAKILNDSTAPEPLVEATTREATQLTADLQH